MAGDVGSIPELDQQKYDSDQQVKIICLGDSAVGKSKWVLQLTVFYTSYLWYFYKISVYLSTLAQ